jgi:hypothetical protein
MFTLSFWYEPGLCKQANLVPSLYPTYHPLAYFLLSFCLNPALPFFSDTLIFLHTLGLAAFGREQGLG